MTPVQKPSWYFSELGSVPESSAAGLSPQRLGTSKSPPSEPVQSLKVSLSPFQMSTQLSRAQPPGLSQASLAPPKTPSIAPTLDRLRPVAVSVGWPRYPRFRPGGPLPVSAPQQGHHRRSAQAYVVGQADPGLRDLAGAGLAP